MQALLLMLKTLLSLVVVAGLVPTVAAQQFVTANRGSGDITVFDREGLVLQTVALPSGMATPEPMYVVQVGDEVLVGDRGNDRIVRFDRTTYAVNGVVPAGAGVFHMWANFGQLWVNNDVDLTVSVIDTATWAPLATVPIPMDLAAMGYRPHDVFVGNRSAYVSLLGGSGNYDWVVQFDRTTFQETARIQVGKDPHLWLDVWSDSLMVATQEGNGVQVFDRGSLRIKGRLAQSGAHGLFVPDGTRTLLIADITSNGAMGLYANSIDTMGRVIATDSEDVPAPRPHNIAASRFGQRIFVTHAGATSTTVSIYELGGSSEAPVLTFLRAVTSGVHPFGLAVIEG